MTTSERTEEELLKEAEELASALSARFEALGASAEGKARGTWARASKEARRLRGVCREQSDRRRRRLLP